MELLIAIIIGMLYAAGIFLILRRSIVKLIIGLLLLGTGANLLIFASGKVKHGNPPIFNPNQLDVKGTYADPIPQALILTSLVISFGINSFAIILINRSYLAVKTDDLDTMKSTDL